MEFVLIALLLILGKHFPVGILFWGSIFNFEDILAKT